MSKVHSFRCLGLNRTPKKRKPNESIRAFLHSFDHTSLPCPRQGPAASNKKRLMTGCTGPGQGTGDRGGRVFLLCFRCHRWCCIRCRGWRFLAPCAHAVNKSGTAHTYLAAVKPQQSQSKQCFRQCFPSGSDKVSKYRAG